MNYPHLERTVPVNTGTSTNAPPDGKGLSRAALHHLFRWLLRRRSSAFLFNPKAVALIFAPHPDDEVFGCGGLIHRKCLAGHSVHVAYLTDGSASHPGHPTLSPIRLKTMRAEEARQAVEILGVDSAKIYFLGAQDGSLDTLDRESLTLLLGKIENVLRTVKPDEIFLPYRRDGSSEHEAAFRLLQTALAHLVPRPQVYEFPVWSWWSPRFLLRLVCARARVLRCDLHGYESVKWRSICSYRSQTQAVAPWSQPVLPIGFAEAFQSSEEFFFEIPISLEKNLPRTAHE